MSKGFVFTQRIWKVMVVGSSLMVGLTIFGSFQATRFYWTAFMVITGSYILVDLLVSGNIKFEKREDNGIHAYLPQLHERKKDITEQQAYIWFIFLILVSAGFSALAITIAFDLDKSLTLFESSLFWSIIITGYLSNEMLSFYGEKLSLRTIHPKQSPP